MYKRIITIALAIALPLSVNASPDNTGDFERHHGKRIEHLTKELGLSADQKTKLEAIFKENRVKFKALHEEQRKQIEGVLTKEQIAKFDELKKQRHEKWQKKHEKLENQKSPEQLKN